MHVRPLIALLALAPPALAETPERLDPARLLGVDVSSTSDAIEKGRPAFSRERLVDGTDWTPWGSRVDDTEGAWIRMRFDSVQYLTRVEFVPGSARTRTTFGQCGRPARVQLSAGERTVDLDLRDRRYQQVIDFDPPLRGRSLTLTVQAVHGSPKVAGVCLSELTVFAEPNPLNGNVHLREQVREAVAALGDDLQGEAAIERLVDVGQPAVRPIMAALDPSNPNQTLRALKALGELGDPRAIGPAARLLEHADAEVRRRALWTLGAVRSKGHVDQVRRWYDQSVGAEKDTAFDALARSGSPRALEVVMFELAHGTRARRAFAARHVERFGNDAVGAITPLLDSDDTDVRAAALRALGGLAHPEADARLADAMVDVRPHIRAAAIEALGRRGGPDALARVRARAGSRFRIERLAVAEALGRFARPADLDTLDLMTADGSLSVRAAAARALGRLGEPARKKLKTLALIGPDGGTATAAAESLVSRPGAAPIAEAIGLLASRHEDVRTYATELLASHGEAGRSALIAAVVGPDDAVRGFAAAELRRLGDAALPELLGAARHAPEAAQVEVLGLLAEWKNEEATLHATRWLSKGADLLVRRAAIRALAACADPRVSGPAVLSALQDPAPEVRTAAVEALGTMRVLGATQPLIELLEAGDRSMQRAAARALGQIRQRVALYPLLDQYKNIRNAARESAYREDIVAAIGAIGGTDALPTLIDAMGDHDLRVRRAAQNALQ